MMRDLTPVIQATRSIDIGYHNTKFTTGRDPTTKAIRTGIFPSMAVPASRPAGAVGGAVAADDRDSLILFEDIQYYVGPDAGLHTTGVDPRTLSADYSSTPEYKVLVYGALSRIAAKSKAKEVRIEDLVVGLPCNTIAANGERLKAWLENVGKPHLVGPGPGEMRAISVARAHVIPQPYGAMLDYGINQENDVEGWTLVVDAGGGTLDWFFCSKQEGNWNRSGAHPKAMLECAYAVCDAIDKRLRDNFNVVTRIDHAIRGASETFKCSGKEYKIADFSQEIDRVVNESLSKMMQSVGDTSDIDLILVAGGGGSVFARAMAARYPELANRIKEYTSEPVFSNVRGFHAYGEVFAGAA